MLNISNKTDGVSTQPAVEMNSVFNELKNLVTDSGQTLGVDDFQISRGAAINASGSDFYTDSGTANAKVLTSVGSKKAPLEYFDGQKIRFRVGVTNTGATTANVAIVGLVDLVDRDGVAFSGGELVADDEVEFSFHDPSGDFRFVATSSSTGTVASSALPRGYKSGFTLSNAADVDHDITAQTGSARDSANAADIILNSELTKQIDVDWVAGNNAGGFPSALTLSANTTYHYFVIVNGSGDVDAGFDSALNASNLLSDSGYVGFKRVGSRTTDGSSNLLPFNQNKDIFTEVTRINDFSGVPGSYPQTLVTSAPIDIKVRALLSSRGSRVSVSTGHLAIGSDFQDRTEVFASEQDVGGSGYIEVLTNESAEILYGYVSQTLSNSNIDFVGYIDLFED